VISHSPPAAVQVTEVCAGYNDTDVLKSVTLQVEQGEFVGIIGPNGCGKTTTLRVITRSLRPSSGSVNILGSDAYRMSAREFSCLVALVPQDAFTAFDFTVLEVALMGRSPWMGRFAVEGESDYEIAREALHMTGTEDLADRPISHLSGGERQRVMVARALAQQPRILFLDEPTSHLDISFQFEVMDLIRRLNRDQGLTVVAVLHDLNLASQYCGRLALIGEGRVRAVGSPEEVITAGTIREVYGAEVWVRKHPATHRPYVIAGIKGNVRPSEDPLGTPGRVHVIGGGGTSAPIIARLLRRGYGVTAGMLTVGDADQEVADALDVPFVRLHPFSPVTRLDESQQHTMIDDADTVILSDTPIGHGNIPNVRACLYAVRNGKRVLLLRARSVGDRDFTGGEGAALVEELLQLGARSADDVEGVLQFVEKDGDSQVEGSL